MKYEIPKNAKILSINSDYLDNLVKGEKFWQGIMEKCKKWNCRLYEQDWLDTQFYFNQELRTKIGSADEYLEDMNSAADKSDMDIMYCMPLSMHILKAGQLKKVKVCSSSMDYYDRNKICLQSFYWYQLLFNNMLIFLMGMYPYRDTFITNKKHPSREATVYEKTPDSKKGVFAETKPL